MFEEVITKEAFHVIKRIGPFLHAFYLGGGTGLALQIGHRISYDLDFFTPKDFWVEELLQQLKADKIHSIEKGTIHCELRGVRLSFLHYDLPLIFEPVKWQNIKVAHWLDIAAEKLKTVSQRGSKKDFYDIFFAIKNSSIEQICSVFTKRFKDRGINRYHVLKSLVYFEDAEEEPDPQLLRKDVNWSEIKEFFKKNIKEFERFILYGGDSIG